jgi:sec-independent protein translocase protein TatA
MNAKNSANHQKIVVVTWQQQRYLSTKDRSYRLKAKEVKCMLNSWEWLIIGIVAIVIIMWGPAKIPEFAKALGRARGEFNKASKEFTDAANLSATESPTQSKTVTTMRTIKTKDQILLETAKNLGIDTEGKTQQEISEEISMKVKLLGA